MIARDRDLLARLAAVNTTLGRVTTELLARQDGGELPAGPLREVGTALRRVADDMLIRADEISARGTVPTPALDE